MSCPNPASNPEATPNPVQPEPPTDKDPSVCAAIKAAAEKSLSRGFTILTCKPFKKDPWASYSPNAVNSATSNPADALRPWNDGYAANYGVACGRSNLTVIDCDSGLADEAALTTWMAKNNLPETFIVKSGRDTSAGFHLYYSGSVATTAYDIDGVVGELRGHGSYVVGPGSIHPSGQKYEIIRDVTIAPLPDHFTALAKEKNKTVLPPNGELIKEGNRWNHLQSTAGKLKNAGLDEDGIYNGLKNFAAVNCENGDSYPDEKLRNLAEWAASDDCEAPLQTVVFVGDGKIDVSVASLPDDALGHNWISDVARLLTVNTPLPPSFLFTDLKTILGASIDGLVAFPSQNDFHLRQWSFKISDKGGAGKGESWKRTGEGCLADYIDKTGVGLPDSGNFSSGEHMIKYLASEFEDKNVVVNFDEMRDLFTKGSAKGSTLLVKLLPLFERKNGTAKSLTFPKGGEFKNISMSLTGGFTRSGFENSLAGQNTSNDGFLSRVTLDYAERKAKKSKGDWPQPNWEAVEILVAKMLTRYKEIFEDWSKHNPDGSNLKLKKWKFVPHETEAARDLRQEFEVTISGEERLVDQFRRDLILRAIFSDANEITVAVVTEAIAWAKHQSYLRKELKVPEGANLVEQMEKRIKHLFLKYKDQHKYPTQRDVEKGCHLERGSTGGVGVFQRAWGNFRTGNDPAIKPLGGVEGQTRSKTQRWVWDGEEL